MRLNIPSLGGINTGSRINRLHQHLCRGSVATLMSLGALHTLRVAIWHGDTIRLAILVDATSDNQRPNRVVIFHGFL